MLKPELYEKTVSILVQAYLNDTLEHSNCYACAVGNLIASARGYGYTYACGRNEWDSAEDVAWQQVFVTIGGGSQNIYLSEFNGAAKKQILSTGYDLAQLAKIEFAFESAPRGSSSDEWMFNGLMAVIDILDQIHGNADTEVTTTQKNRFTKLVTA